MGETMDSSGIGSSSRDDDAEKTNKHLFKHCMKGEWRKVVERYKRDKNAHWAKITRAGDTALHVAVTDGQDEVVEQLVELIREEQVLRIQNERGNTALHFAASTGSVQMCIALASKDHSLLGIRNNIASASKEPSLLGIRNCEGETPLFLAALNGRRDAFMALHYFWAKSIPNTAPNYYSICRRSTDGETILHSAIAGEYFDLAFQIIHLYGDLVNSKNERGSSPLHVLASKPSAFGSGSRLGLFEKLIYFGIIIKDLEVAPPDHCYELCPIPSKDKIWYPENYRTCMGLLSMIKKSALVVIITPVTQLYQKSPLPRVLNPLCVKMKKALKMKPKPRDLEAPEKTVTNGAETNSSGSETRVRSHQLYPDNYKSCATLFKIAFLVLLGPLLVFFGNGLSIIFIRIRREKQKHVWSAQITDQLLKGVSMYDYDDTGNKPRQINSEDNAQETVPYAFDKSGGVALVSIKQQPSTSEGEAKQQRNGDEKNLREKMPLETPILIAAKHGVTEMVEKILERFPVAILDTDAENKNIVLLAVENRQSHLYQFLLERKILNESMFRKVDSEGNSALHLAAKLGDTKPWLISGEALQMHWEIKWFLFVKESMPPHFFPRYNNDKKTPEGIFSETHKHLHKSGMDWLSKTSESCSLVAALIATVAFATSTTVPGGVQESTGIPTLEDTTAFHVFAISSLIALCCSVTAVVLFLTILTSRYQEDDFGKDLPRKLIFGLTSLFVSITSMMISFYAGHFYMIKDKLKYAAFPVYAVICLPVTLYTLAQFSLYFDLIWATFRTVPQSSYRTTLH